MLSLKEMKEESLQRLRQLIRIPSFSREEQGTADFIGKCLMERGLTPQRSDNNVWAYSSPLQQGVPTILLCSHHDTVRPVAGWTEDPFAGKISGNKLIGLGANDAGASLMALLTTFLYFDQMAGQLPFNLVYAAVAEEEISGPKGVSSILPQIGPFDLAIIGEPTEMQMAIAEKGLMVIDAETSGKAGHAARNEGINALYLAVEDIAMLRTLEFPETSDLLGPVKLTVTQIEAGTQHNVVPDKCHYVIDVRTNELYSNREALDTIQAHTHATLTPRSLRLNSSRISVNHPVVRKGRTLGLDYFGSPTLSDQALIPGPTIKIGCGDSARSHTANEFIYLHELDDGIDIYIQLLDQLKL